MVMGQMSCKMLLFVPGFLSDSAFPPSLVTKCSKERGLNGLKGFSFYSVLVFYQIALLNVFNSKVVIISHTLPCFLALEEKKRSNKGLSHQHGGWVGGRGLHNCGTEEINVGEGARILVYLLFCL